MGKCIYCGKPAGFLRSKHVECEQQHQQQERIIQAGCALIVSEARAAFKGGEPFSTLENNITEIMQSHSVSSDQRKSSLIRAWGNAVEDSIEDGIVDHAEEERLIEFRDHFRLSETDLKGNGALQKFTKAVVIRDVVAGKIPQRTAIAGELPINFQKGESLVWAFADSKYVEDKTKRQYVGGSHGVSIRVMEGVYYRVGAFKGRAVESTERVHVDSGWFVVTDKNIYFAGPRKSLRIPYGKIVSFDAFSDGIGVVRDSTTAKSQFFITGDGWFTYNLVANLAKQ